MDSTQYPTLTEVLAAILDPRTARGKRHSWVLLLTLLAAGLARGHQTAHAIAHRVMLHADPLRAVRPEVKRLPRESTLLRTLRQIDVRVLEQALAHRTQPQPDGAAALSQIVTPCGTPLQAQAVDGKALRGATSCGAPTQLVSLVQHGCGGPLAQAAVAHKRSAITAIPAVLHGRDLSDTIMTMDALLPQRTLAQQLIDQQGYYRMIVTANQPQLRDAVALFFELPAIPADPERWDRVCTIRCGHGRRETRPLECTTGDCAWLGWPGDARCTTAM